MLLRDYSTNKVKVLINSSGIGEAVMDNHSDIYTILVSLPSHLTQVLESKSFILSIY
jgi:hypothetical protein